MHLKCKKKPTTVAFFSNLLFLYFFLNSLFLLFHPLIKQNKAYTLANLITNCMLDMHCAESMIHHTVTASVLKNKVLGIIRNTNISRHYLPLHTLYDLLLSFSVFQLILLTLKNINKFLNHSKFTFHLPYSEKIKLSSN